MKVSHDRRLGFKDDKDLRPQIEGAWLKGRCMSDLSGTLGSVKITSQAGLRAVNGTRAREDAKGPNKTLESAEVREIDMGEGVIIPGIIRKGLDWTLNSADVR